MQDILPQSNHLTRVVELIYEHLTIAEYRLHSSLTYPLVCVSLLYLPVLPRLGKAQAQECTRHMLL